jgi:transcriptional regulator with XRE-family HTH domain
VNLTGHRIRYYRLRAGLDVENLAFRTGIDAERIRQMEERTAEVYDTDLTAIAEALGVEFGRFFLSERTQPSS